MDDITNGLSNVYALFFIVIMPFFLLCLACSWEEPDYTNLRYNPEDFPRDAGAILRDENFWQSIPEDQILKTKIL